MAIKTNSLIFRQAKIIVCSIYFKANIKINILIQFLQINFIRLSYKMKSPSDFQGGQKDPLRLEAQTSVALDDFIKQINKSPYPLTYVQQYIKWSTFLTQQRNNNPNQYLLVLQKFLQRFPFNKKYWFQYISLAGEEAYRIALNKNPKCFELWESYIQNLSEKYKSQTTQSQRAITTPAVMTTPTGTTPVGGNSVNNNIFKKQLQKAIAQIGADRRAGKLYILYQPLVAQNYKYEFYKKVFVRCLDDLETFYNKFEDYIDKCAEEQIKLLYLRQNKGRVNAQDINITIAREFLKDQLIKIYKATLNYRSVRNSAQAQILWLYFQDSFHRKTPLSEIQPPSNEQIQENVSRWHDMIELQRKHSVVQNIVYCYERSTLSHPDRIDFWQQTFFYLQNETGRYQKVLAIMRNNKNFFQFFPGSRDLFFYWCDLQQRQKPAKARQMYLQMKNHYIQSEKESGNQNLPISSYEILMKLIQLEIRQKQSVVAKQIFDQMLKYFSDNVELMGYILIEYVYFVTKHYKDYEYAKKLLKMYFDFLPFNEYLFMNYLEFMKNFENKEGHYDQLMVIILNGMAKAKKSLLDIQYQKLIKSIKFYLRNNLGSIYLIKMSQRKVLDLDSK